MNDEVRALVRENPAASAMYAVNELHYGRLAWLAHHIRVCDFQISPVVARKILAMIENSEPNCYFELRATRRSDLPPRFEDPQLKDVRNLEMARDVARLGGFKRGHMKRACAEVAHRYSLSPDYVERQIRPHRQMAIDAAEEEAMQAAYERGEIDFLGRPISP